MKVLNQAAMQRSKHFLFGGRMFSSERIAAAVKDKIKRDRDDLILKNRRNLAARIANGECEEKILEAINADHLVELQMSNRLFESEMIAAAKTMDVQKQSTKKTVIENINLIAALVKVKDGMTWAFKFIKKKMKIGGDSGENGGSGVDICGICSAMYVPWRSDKKKMKESDNSEDAKD